MWFLPLACRRLLGVHQGGVPAEVGGECGGVEGAPDAMPIALDAALAAILAAVAIERREAGEAGDLTAGEPSELGHEDEDEKAERGAPTDSLNALDEGQATGEIGLGGDGFGEQQQFGLHTPLQPVGLARQRALEAGDVIGLGAGSGADEVTFQLLDEAQMLGERLQPRVGCGAHRVEPGGAVGDQRRIEPIVPFDRLRTGFASFSRNSAKARTWRG